MQIQKLFFFVFFSLFWFLLGNSIVSATNDTSYPRFLNNNDARQIHIPFEIVDNRIVITVEHESLGQLRLLLDTGATTSVLFKSYDPYVKTIPSHGSKFVRFPALGLKSLAEKIERLPIKVDDWHYVLENLAYIAAPSALGSNIEHKFDGIVGRELFESYSVAINIDTRIITLVKPDIDISNLYDHSLSLDLRTKTPFVEIKAKFPWEHRYSRKKLLIDMGYPGTIVVWGKKHYRDATTLAEYAYYRKRDIGFEMNATFKFASNTFRKIPGYLNPKSPYYSEKREGIIGTAILNNYNYAFDYKRGKLYLRPTMATFNKNNLIAYVPNDEIFVKKRFTKTTPEKLTTGPRLVIR